MLESGHLGRIPNCSEVPKPHPPPHTPAISVLYDDWSCHYELDPFVVPRWDALRQHKFIEVDGQSYTLHNGKVQSNGHVCVCHMTWSNKSSKPAVTFMPPREPLLAPPPPPGNPPLPPRTPESSSTQWCVYAQTDRPPLTSTDCWSLGCSQTSRAPCKAVGVIQQMGLAYVISHMEVTSDMEGSGFDCRDWVAILPHVPAPVIGVFRRPS